MLNKFSGTLTAILLAVVFTALVLINNHLLSDMRLDLTEDQVYSLSDGSKEILKAIDEPVHLYFFYSDKASNGMTSLRNYANRVESLLEEYASASDGKIILHKIDPVPFSEAEDKANQFGLTGATVGNGGDPVYLGLAGSNAYDDEKIIAFFDPKQESFLEYDISKLVYQLTDPKKVHVSVITDLAVMGGQNPMTGRMDPPWTIFTQLQQLYDVQKLGNDIAEVPADTDVLLLVNPKNYSEQLQFSIDQYAMHGGKVLAFVDPHTDSDPMSAMTGNGATDINNLLASWGIEFNGEQVVLDAASGLDIRTQNGVERHLGYLGLQGNALDKDDVVTASLDVINAASVGALMHKKDSKTKFIPLIQTSDNSGLIDGATYGVTRDVNALASKFTSTNTAYTVAARLSGTAKSAFDKVPDGVETDDFVADTKQLNVIVVADTDLLTDRFWGSQSNFFGQTIFTPFANNGDFVTNAVENLGGSNALISVRSRGTSARPFDVVDALTVKAEKRFREKEQQLQQELQQTEQQLSQLQGQQAENGALVLSDEQQQAIEQFMQKKIAIRKELREVRHQLDMDIENLGSELKFINIAVAPLILVLLLGFIARISRKRASKEA
ncbi:GldG family protein [Neptunicella marina]|uniref:Gldg family protein n=1 Tax=Neptunicella marina TaxID=2125989 RepID=A0A8J6M2K3_9ALTE|nr:Gldg family protein [Neptunicella marina]MBC3766403.1 Gldg family protein [Neptunicella marina]